MKASRAFQKNKFDDAERLYLEVLEKSPDNYEGQLWLGSLYSEIGKNQKAIDLLTNCIRIRPADFRAYVNLALLQAKLNQHGLAIGILEKALSKCKMGATRKAEIFYSIGQIKISLRDFNGAINYANQALAIYPQHQNAEKVKLFAYSQLRK